MTESTVTQGWLELDRDCRRARDPMKVKVDRCKGDRKGNVGKLICPCWKATPLCEQINFLENSDRILSIRPLASPPPFFPTTAFVSVRFSRRRALVWRRRHLVFFPENRNERWFHLRSLAELGSLIVSNACNLGAASGN